MRMRNSLRHGAFALTVAMLALALAGCAAGMPGRQTMGAGAQQAGAQQAGAQQAGAQQAGAQQAGAQQAMPVPAPEPGKLTVVNVRARPAPLEGGNGAAFLTVLNGLDKAVRLASVSGTAAGAIELHETVNDNGVMKMEPHPEGFEVPAGGALELKPGGKHVMLLGLTKPLAVGDSIDLTLNFEGSDPITLTVPVMDIQAMMPSAAETPKP